MRVLRLVSQYTAHLRVALICLACAAFAGPTLAQTFPDRPVRILVPFAAGGPTDVVARLVGERLSRVWEQPVVIENKPGGGANLGAAQVARSKADGYTLLLTTPALAAAPILYPSIKVDPLKDFIPISSVAQTAPILVVNPSIGVNTVQELIAKAKGAPGTLAFASTGSGTPLHLTAEMFKSMAGIDVLHVPYKGSSPALTDLLGGRVAYMFDSPLTSLPHVRSGALKALAVGSRERSQLAPDVPTLAEAGLRDFEAIFWYALFAPAGTPTAIIEKISRDVASVVREQAVRERLIGLGAEPLGTSAVEFSSSFRRDMARWSEAARNSGVKAE